MKNSNNEHVCNGNDNVSTNDTSDNNLNFRKMKIEQFLTNKECIEKHVKEEVNKVIDELIKYQSSNKECTSDVLFLLIEDMNEASAWDWLDFTNYIDELDDTFIKNTKKHTFETAFETYFDSQNMFLRIYVGVKFVNENSI